MPEPTLPTHLVEARRTPVFDLASLPGPLAVPHRTTVWAELIVESGSVRYIDLQGDPKRDERLDGGDRAVIAPGVSHQIEPSTDARFHVQFYREPDADLVPGQTPDPLPTRLAQGPWVHRGRDLDTVEEIFELVTRQYADVVQDPLLSPYFNFGPDHMDWQAHILSVADYWNHVLLYAPDYEIDVLEHHRPIHERQPFDAALFDRWLEIFVDTVDGGWTGERANHAKKRATGMVWAMARRLLGEGAWQRPADRR